MKRSIFISFNYLSLKFYSVNKFNNISLVSTLFIVAMHKYVERKLTVDNVIYIYIKIYDEQVQKSASI